MASKKILIIQDLACYGNSSMHVASTILTSMGFETAILPIKLTSTTNSFENQILIKFDDELDKIVDHLISERVKFDCIYVGNVEAKEHFNLIKKCNDYLKADDGILVVNAQFSHGGKLNEGLNEDVIVGMMDLASISNYFIPNVSSLSLITRADFNPIQDDSYLNDLISSAVEIGVKNLILTGVMDDEYSIGVIAYDGLTKTTIIKEKEENEYPGIKDAFSSIFIGYILQGRSLKESIDHATDFILDTIYNTYNNGYHDYAISYEELLKLYIDKKDPRY